MKRKFWVVLLTVLTALCLCFGFAACEKEESGGNTGDGSQTEQPGGSQGGSQTEQPGGTQGGSQTEQPGGSQGGSQTEQPGGMQGGTEKPHVHSYGSWRTVEEATCTKAGKKQRECSCGDVQYDTIPQKDHTFVNSVCTSCGAVEPGAIEVKVYIDNVVRETLYTNAEKEYKIALPAKPEDMTTDPYLTNYFDGWYADRGYNEPLTGGETYSTPSAIYGRNITSRTYDFSYTVNAGQAIITRFTNSTATTVVVPRYINSFPVTMIGKLAFQDKTMLRTVFLCEGLKIIDRSAFWNCNSMQKVVIPSTVTMIGRGAFNYCGSLQEVHITDLSAWCKIDFEEGPFCRAYHLYLNGDEVKNLTIPSDIKEIKDYAFADCSGLTSLSIPDGVTSIGGVAFQFCSGLTGELKIPDSVTSIGDGAFADCSGLTSIKIPDSVTLIGGGAFSGCSRLTSVKIGNGVTKIEGGAFANTGLTSITIPASVTYIGSGVCSGCNLKEAYFENPNGWIHHYRWYNSYTGKEVVTTAPTSVGVSSLFVASGDWLTRS